MTEDNFICSERRDRNELILYKLANPRRTWSEGPVNTYGINYCWHKFDTGNNVMGSDWSLWTKEEIAPVLNGDISLFDICELVS